MSSLVADKCEDTCQKAFKYWPWLFPIQSFKLWAAWELFIFFIYVYIPVCIYIYINKISGACTRCFV